MPRGGYHSHAERWGRPSGWQNGSATKTIRVPESLAEQVLDLAHKLDEGQTLFFLKPNNALRKAAKDDLSGWLREAIAEKLAREGAA